MRPKPSGRTARPQEGARRGGWSLAALVVLALAGAVGAQTLEGQEIKRIEVITTPRLDQARVRDMMRTRLGDVYRAQTVEDDVARLHKLGSLLDVSITPKPFEDGVMLIVEAKEPAVATAVRFEGDLRGQDEDDLLEATLVKEGKYAEPYQLKLDVRSIEALYRQEGFIYARVTQRLEPNPKGVDVVYSIQSGPRERVESIHFAGNTAFDDDTLSDKMTGTQPRTVLSPGTYDPDLLRADLDNVRDHYRRKGWLDATAGARLIHDDTLQRLFIEVRLREGERYRIEGVDIAGYQLFTRAEVEAVMEQKAGEWYSPDGLDEDRKKIESLFGQQGRVFVAVRTKVTVDVDRLTAKIAIAIEEGPEVYLKNILVMGNHRTQDRVIRRNLTFDPGQRINTQRVEESTRRLRNTGLFAAPDPTTQTEPVRIRYQKTEDPNWANAVVEVVEGRLGNVSLGFAFNSVSGLAGRFAVTHENFDWADTPKSFRDLYSGDAYAGGAQQLTLSLSPGQYVSDYRLKWYNPALYDTIYSGGFDLYSTDNVYSMYTDSRAGVTLTGGRRYFQDLVVSLNLIWENIWIHGLQEEDDGGYVQDVLDAKGDHEKRALDLRAVWDKRDDFYFPTKGYRVQGDIELSGTPLGGDVHVMTETFEASRYWTLYKDRERGEHVLHLRGKIGFIQPTSDDGVPIFERFFLGGLGSVRGFDYRGIGPVDSVYEEQIGGKVMYVANLEYFVPIVKSILHGLLFVDAGSLSADIPDLGTDKLRLGTGVGVRLRIPQLGGGHVPIALDFGFPVLKEDTDQTAIFSFSLGSGFAF